MYVLYLVANGAAVWFKHSVNIIKFNQIEYLRITSYSVKKISVLINYNFFFW